ncbi:MAG: acylneuraminate cytidylyltransferase family protein [Candidatus Rokubacteria bacterium]|nr:acylneuraminate cytidylyltransferase family protein [Candidatus Rokubacteria bacterium]
MKILAGEAWAIIPARGGSKSIPLKNLAPLGGRPLIEYVIDAGLASRRISRIICSTDHDGIAAVCAGRDVEVHRRPAALARDETPVVDVLCHLLEDLGAREGGVAELVPLLQPTSPFVLPGHIDACLEALARDPRADSAQTIATLPHNHHAYNQRVVEDGLLRFRFPEERARFYAKQTKPKHYVFGNLVVTRSSTIVEKRTLFGDRSLPVEIPFRYATDVDTQEDLELAEWLLATGRVIVSGGGATR